MCKAYKMSDKKQLSRFNKNIVGFKDVTGPFKYSQNGVVVQSERKKDKNCQEQRTSHVPTSWLFE